VPLIGGAGGGARYGESGGGGGGGGARTIAPPVTGLISLAPPLVEEGRPYAFRKLDASAVVTVSARMPDIGRRLAAAGAFLALVAVVWAVRRRARNRLQAAGCRL